MNGEESQILCSELQISVQKSPCLPAMVLELVCLVKVRQLTIGPNQVKLALSKIVIFESNIVRGTTNPCVDSKAEVTLLASSLRINLVSTSARVTSAKCQVAFNIKTKLKKMMSIGFKAFPSATCGARDNTTMLFSHLQSVVSHAPDRPPKYPHAGLPL